MHVHACVHVCVHGDDCILSREIPTFMTVHSALKRLKIIREVGIIIGELVSTFTTYKHRVLSVPNKLNESTA